MAKYDTIGNNIWVKLLGATGQKESLYSVIKTYYNNFLIVGWQQQSQNSVNNDAYLIKIDTNGSIIWNKTYGNSNINEWGVEITEIEKGNFLVSGISQYNGDWDKYVFKIDGEGTMLWDTIWGTSGTNDRQVYVNSISEGYALAVSGVKIGSSNRVMSLYDFDANGDIVWEKELEFGNNAGIWRIHKNLDGTLLLYGNDYKLAGSIPVPYLLCITPRGDTLWSKNYYNQLNRDNYIYDMLQNEDNSYVFVGVDWPLSTNGWIKSLDCMGCDSIQCYFPDSCFVYDCNNDYPPEANFTLAQDTFYYKDGDTVSIKFKNSSTASAGYTWFMGTGDSLNLVNPNYSFTTPGDYEITLVARNLECTDTAKATLHILDATGISEYSMKNDKLRIYANPATNVINIQIPTSLRAERSNLCIYNAQGQLTDCFVPRNDESKESNKVQIDVSEYPKGVYFVVLQTEKGVMKSNFIVE